MLDGASEKVFSCPLILNCLIWQKEFSHYGTKPTPTNKPAHKIRSGALR